MKQILTICMFFLIVNVSAQTSAELVQGCIDKIRQLPEVRELITEIQKEGPIRFAITEHELSKKFGAFWDLDQRVICVNPDFHETEGEIIGSMLFEMQNAFSNSTAQELFRQAEKGEIDKDSFVRAMEFQEYTNSHRAAEMAQIGIDRGIFPKSALLPTYDDFEEHFYYQKKGGHAAWFARSYDYISPK